MSCCNPKNGVGSPTSPPGPTDIPFYVDLAAKVLWYYDGTKWVLLCGCSGTPPVGSPPVGSPPVGTPPVGSPPVGSPPVGSPPVGSPPVGSPPVGSPPVGSPTCNIRVSQNPSQVNGTVGTALTNASPAQINNPPSGTLTVTQVGGTTPPGLAVSISQAAFSPGGNPIYVNGTPTASGNYSGVYRIGVGTCTVDVTINFTIAGTPPVGSPPVGSPPVGSPPVGSPPVGSPPVGSPK